MCEAIVESTTLNGDVPVPDFDLINAFQIYDLVLEPVRDLLRAASHLLFVPDGPLWSIPLQCLVTGPVEAWDNASPKPESDDVDASSEQANEAEEDDGLSPSFPRSRQRLIAFGSWVRERTASDALSTITQRQLWVADRYAISVMPSLVPLMGRSFSAGGEDRRRSFLGIGDPTINRVLSPDVAAVPETRQILSSFAAALDANLDQDIVAGDAATLDRLIDLSESGALAARRVICFATHATYPRDYGDQLTEAALVFANGELLTAFDVVGLRLDADLVLLTACFTGAPSGRSVTVPLSGLAQAFLKAGARCLLVSNWPVDAQATELFASRFAAEMAAGSTIAAALRAAEGHLRDQPPYSQPTFWSGFSIVGDGAKVIIPAACGV